MTTSTEPVVVEHEEAAVLERLSLLDRYLPLWIGAAMALGLALGRVVPDLNDTLDPVKIGTVSLPCAIGLLLMTYPVLAKVRYDDIGHVTADRRLLGSIEALRWAADEGRLRGAQVEARHAWHIPYRGMPELSPPYPDHEFEVYAAAMLDHAITTSGESNGTVDVLVGTTRL